MSLIDPPSEPDGEALVITVHGNRVAILDGGAPADGLFLGTLSGRHCWAADAELGPVDDSVLHEDLRRLWGTVDEVVWMLAGRAVQLVEWARTHRFCGRCGKPTEAVAGERARRCTACGHLAYPRLAPAVITLIERSYGKALLARNATSPSRRSPASPASSNRARPWRTPCAGRCSRRWAWTWPRSGTSGVSPGRSRTS